MDDSKPWYQSKGIWAATVSALVGVYTTVAQIKGLPPIPGWVLTLLGGFGVYARASATAQITAS